VRRQCRHTYTYTTELVVDSYFILCQQKLILLFYFFLGHTALHTAIIAHGTRRPNGNYINSLNTIETLIKAGADPNSQVTIMHVYHLPPPGS
jgi:hypothetical protein